MTDMLSYLPANDGEQSILLKEPYFPCFPSIGISTFTGHQIDRMDENQSIDNKDFSWIKHHMLTDSISDMDTLFDVEPDEMEKPTTAVHALDKNNHIISHIHQLLASENTSLMTLGSSNVNQRKRMADSVPHQFFSDRRPSKIRLSGLNQVFKNFINSKFSMNFASEHNEDGFLPLHIACRDSSDDVKLVEAILNANPDAIRTTYTSTRLSSNTSQFPGPSSRFSGNSSYIRKHCRLCNFSYPLHIALSTGQSSLEVIKLLVQRAPDILLKGDGNGSVPLSIAIQNNASDEIILYLLSMNTEACKIANFRMNYPLHFASMTRRPSLSMKVAQCLVDGFPGAILSRNADGRTSLDLSAFSSCDESMINYMQSMAYSCYEVKDI